MPQTVRDITIDMKKTGRLLRRHMEEQHLSARSLARLLGITYAQTVYRWIRGETLPSIDHFYRLSKIFGCRIDDLVAGNDSDENENEGSLHKV